MTEIFERIDSGRDRAWNPRLVRLSRKDEGTIGRILGREWVMYCLRTLGRDGNPAKLSDAFAERGRLMVREEIETLLESGWPLDGSVLTKVGLKRIRGIAIDHALGMLRDDERFKPVADHFSKPNSGDHSSDPKGGVAGVSGYLPG